MNYTEEEVEKIIIYTKELEYLDGTKPQRECTAEYILSKWADKYKVK